mgnify:CR=1 FL=1
MALHSQFECQLVAHPWLFANDSYTGFPGDVGFCQDKRPDFVIPNTKLLLHQESLDVTDFQLFVFPKEWLLASENLPRCTRLVPC